MAAIFVFEDELHTYMTVRSYYYSKWYFIVKIGTYNKILNKYIGPCRTKVKLSHQCYTFNKPTCLSNRDSKSESADNTFYLKLDYNYYVEKS